MSHAAPYWKTRALPASWKSRSALCLAYERDWELTCPKCWGSGGESGWEGCKVGDGSSLCLVTWKVERQKPSCVSKGRQRLEWSQGIAARCAAEGWPLKVKPEGRGEATHVPSLEEIVLPAFLLYTHSCFCMWFIGKSLHLLAVVSGGAERKTKGNISAGER